MEIRICKIADELGKSAAAQIAVLLREAIAKQGYSQRECPSLRPSPLW